MTVGTFTGALQPSLNERRCDDRSLDSSHGIDAVDWAVSIRFRTLSRNVSAVATGVANLSAGIHRAFSRDVTLEVFSIQLKKSKNSEFHIRASHRHSTSWPVLDNREHSGLGRHTCSRWQDEVRQRNHP